MSLWSMVVYNRVVITSKVIISNRETSLTLKKNITSTTETLIVLHENSDECLVTGLSTRN